MHSQVKPKKKTKSDKLCPFCKASDLLVVRDPMHTSSSHHFSLVKCSTCHLVFQKPLPSDEEISRYYSRDEFGNSKYYSLSINEDIHTFDGYFDIIKRYKQSGTILEIGSSVGTLLHVSKRHGFVNQTGVELNDNSIAQCKKNYPDFVIHKSLPTSQKFDLIVMSDVIEHLPDPFTYLEKLRSILNDGGIIFIITPDFDSLVARRTQVKPIEHLYYFTKETLKKSIGKAGYKLLYLANISREQRLQTLVHRSTSDKSLLKLIFKVCILLRVSGVMQKLVIKNLKYNLVAVVQK